MGQNTSHTSEVRSFLYIIRPFVVGQVMGSIVHYVNNIVARQGVAQGMRYNEPRWRCGSERHCLPAIGPPDYDTAHRTCCTLVIHDDDLAGSKYYMLMS